MFYMISPNPESNPGSVDGIPVFQPLELANICHDAASRVLVGDQAWEPIAESERTPLDEVPHVVSSGKDWVQYSDGETLVYIDGIPFYLE
jgi:hypothetical protein